MQERHAFDKALVCWKAPEYTHHEKSIAWFIAAGLVVMLLVIYGLETNGWTFSVAILVFAGTYYLFHRHKPELVDIKISKVGIKIGKHAFPYNHIKHFWIVYNPPFAQKLYFRMQSKFHPDIFINLDDACAAKAHCILASFLEEAKGRHEPFSDTLARLLKL